jgi:hypothetical protein
LANTAVTQQRNGLSFNAVEMAFSDYLSACGENIPLLRSNHALHLIHNTVSTAVNSGDDFWYLCCENAPIQVLARRYLNKEINALSLLEQKEFLMLERANEHKNSLAIETSSVTTHSSSESHSKTADRLLFQKIERQYGFNIDNHIHTFTAYRDSLCKLADRPIKVIGTPGYVAPELFENPYRKEWKLYSYCVEILNKIKYKQPIFVEELETLMRFEILKSDESLANYRAPTEVQESVVEAMQTSQLVDVVTKSSEACVDDEHVMNTPSIVEGTVKSDKSELQRNRFFGAMGQESEPASSSQHTLKR